MLTWNDYQSWLEDELKLTLPMHLKCPQATNIQTDSRQLKHNDWFLPLKGENHDGHLFIHKALTLQFADGAFCDYSQLTSIPKSLQKNLIVVKNTLDAYQKIAQGIRKKYSHIKIIALTGSVGKTSTKNLLGLILSEKHQIIPFTDNYNNELGVPKLLTQLKPEHKFAAIEFGARRPGDIKKLVNLAQPNIRACLNVGSSHLEIFKTKENIYSTKLEIISPHHFDLNLVLYDDPYLLQKAKKTNPHTYTFGLNKNADAYLIESKIDKNKGSVFLINLFGKKLEISIPFAHKSLALNVLAAVALAHLAGISHKEIQAGLSKFIGVQGRFLTIKQKDITFIDDSYNASPESMLMGLDSLHDLYEHQDKIIILGDILELGEKECDIYKKLGQLCLKKYKPQLLVTIGKYSNMIAKTASKLGFPDSKIQSYESVDSFLSKKITLENWGHIVYLKGSNNIKLNKIIENYRS